MRYLLDTNSVSDLVRSPQGKLAQHIRKEVKRKSAPALSSLRNCVMGLPRKGHSGSRPSARPCLVR